MRRRSSILTDQADEYANPEPPIHDDFIRAAVDNLEWEERFVIERHFFGNANLTEIGKELSITQAEVRNIRARGLRHLSEAVPEGYEVGSMPAGDHKP